MNFKALNISGAMADDLRTVRINPAAAVRAPSRTVFAQRAARLRQLAPGHVLAGFLDFAAAVADQQQVMLDSDATGCALGALRANFHTLIAGLESRLSPALLAAVDAIEARDEVRFGLLGLSLGAGALPPTDAGFAALPLLGAALQVGATRAALANAAGAVLANHEVLACPVCGGAPVASVVGRDPAAPTVRHAVCGVCASEWPVLAGKCLRCGARDGISHLAANGGSDLPRPAVEVECCDECHAASKIITLDRDPDAEPVADDLATLPLDWLAAQSGWLRYGFNLVFLAPEDEVIDGDDDFAEEDGRA